VADSHLPLLKKIQLIGYTDSRYADLFQNRLSRMSEYLQQQTIPLEAIEIEVKNNEPKKKNGVEFVFSEIQIKPEPVEPPAKPASSATPDTQPSP
jgi:hypothetical protein